MKVIQARPFRKMEKINGKLENNNDDDVKSIFENNALTLIFPT